MGLALSWDYYTFSFDESGQIAVKEAFCRLYDKGLVYRAKRMVNWDVKLQTVLSDIETVTKECEGQMHYIRYKCVDGNEVVVATTRPETIFADQAIAVHPEDTRYRELVGKEFYVPIIDRKIPMVSYNGCSLETGTGVVKIDPAHGFLDFEVAQEFGLPIQPVIDKLGKMCNVPNEFVGLDRFQARSKVVEMLSTTGALVKTEEIKHMVPYGLKSDSVLEPYLSDQWFFDISKLKSGCMSTLDQLVFHPARFTVLYKHYVDNLQPWCISRQIVWGHPIPAYYDEEGRCYVARSLEEAELQSNGKKLKPDSDVLDTWFSSALWPMVTSGWPGKLDGYPNFCLVTGSDILFFWVLKMICMAVALDLGIPFKHVLLHGLVQDEYGLKMSKSRGNTVEPIAFVREHGSDVLRFALVASSVAGNNIKFGKPSIEMARKFAIKVENAFTFCLKNLAPSVPVSTTHPVNHWFLGNVIKIEQKIAEHITNWDLYHAAIALYDFFWDSFCSWYIECTKVLFAECHDETITVLHHCCRRIIRLLYPFLPETAMRYWRIFGEERALDDPEITQLSDIGITSLLETDFSSIQGVINLIRSLRSHFAFKEVQISSNIDKVYHGIIRKLTHTVVTFGVVNAEVRFACGDHVIGLPGLTLMESKQKVNEIIVKLEAERMYLEQKLADEGFRTNADEEDLAHKENRVSEIIAELAVYYSLDQ
jgi:valyl-tRNA synthetase